MTARMSALRYARALLDVALAEADPAEAMPDWLRLPRARAENAAATDTSRPQVWERVDWLAEPAMRLTASTISVLPP